MKYNSSIQPRSWVKTNYRKINRDIGVLRNPAAVRRRVQCPQSTIRGLRWFACNLDVVGFLASPRRGSCGHCNILHGEKTVSKDGKKNIQTFLFLRPRRGEKGIISYVTLTSRSPKASMRRL